MERKLVMIFHEGKIRYSSSEEWEEILGNICPGDEWGLCCEEIPVAQAIQEFRDFLGKPDVEAVSIA